EYDHLGFLLARTHAETSRLPAFMHDAAKVRYIAMASDLQPHVMVIAPTGSGKGVGFVIPNLLQSSCSSVVLDVKGENYEKTSRLRHDAGYKIIRFAPTDYGVESSSYNPLVRISKIEDRGEQMLEVEMLATLFLKTSNDKNESLLSGGRQVFVACTMLAFEQGQPNLGHVYDLVNSGGTDLVDRYKGYADTTDNPRLRIEFEAIAANDPESLANMVSIMNNAGLAPWKHERVRSLTKTTDFEFSDLRSKRPVRPRSVSFQPSSPTASPDPAA
ncbi:MAG: type IV secretory system conjugative DNA transfer family protein, partial [Pseudomonadota bacterium]|nr:type IV secretory system conjugative DNA transfer family protein [Pseudomonadota bacterium]